jgi:putative hemolysin
MKNTFGIAGIFLAVFAVSACTQTAPAPEPPKMLGLANPASVYCTKVGGTLRIETSSEGQYGMCVLPDGTEIEEWALFRRDNPPPKD